MIVRIFLMTLALQAAAFAQSPTATAVPTISPVPTAAPVIPEPTFHTLSVDPYPVAWVLKEYAQGTLQLLQVMMALARDVLAAWTDQDHTAHYYSTTGAFVPGKFTPGVCSWRRKFVSDGPRVGYASIGESYTKGEAAITSEDGLLLGEANLPGGHQRPAGTDQTLAVDPDTRLDRGGFGPGLDFEVVSTGSLKTWAVFPGDAAHQIRIENGVFVWPCDITESTKPTATLRLSGTSAAAITEVAASIHVTSANGLNARAWGALTDRPGTDRFSWRTGVLGQAEDYPTYRPVAGQDGVALALAEGAVTHVTRNVPTSDVKSTATGTIRITLKADGTRPHDITASIRDCELNVAVTGKCRACGSAITTTWATEPARTADGFIGKIKRDIAEANAAAAAERELEELRRRDLEPRWYPY